MKRVSSAFLGAFLLHVGTSKTDVSEGAKNVPFLGPPGLPGAPRRPLARAFLGPFFVCFLSIIFLSSFLVKNAPT